MIKYFHCAKSIFGYKDQKSKILPIRQNMEEMNCLRVSVCQALHLDTVGQLQYHASLDIHYKRNSQAL